VFKRSVTAVSLMFFDLLYNNPYCSSTLYVTVSFYYSKDLKPYIEELPTSTKVLIEEGP